MLEGRPLRRALLLKMTARECRPTTVSVSTIPIHTTAASRYSPSPSPMPSAAVAQIDAAVVTPAAHMPWWMITPSAEESDPAHDALHDPRDAHAGHRAAPWSR